MKIAFQNQYDGYQYSLVPSVLSVLCGKSLEIVGPDEADLLLIGSIRTPKSSYRRFLEWKRKMRSQRPRAQVRLFHTAENIRHDRVPAEYSISFDLGVASDRHFRLPLWMESIDWKHEGVVHRSSPRVESLLPIERLVTPLGSALTKRPWRAALFTSHMEEPRRTLFNVLSKIMPTVGFGRPFDPAIADHNTSGISKDMALRDFAVNLCPENSLYPGYYTEKVVEAFGSGCLPVAWADSNVCVDFNQNAIVNSLEFAAIGYEKGLRGVLNRQAISHRAEEPLLLHPPTIEPLIQFMRRIVEDVR